MSFDITHGGASKNWEEVYQVQTQRIAELEAENQKLKELLLKRIEADNTYRDSGWIRAKELEGAIREFSEAVIPQTHTKGG